jgi:mannosyltransferase OCH1-like enzyme
MQLLTDETRIRRRKRAASHTRDWCVGPTKFLLLLVTLPLLLLFILVKNTHEGKGGRSQRNSTDKHQQYIISPEALRSRSEKIIERTRHKKETSFRSRLGSPDHPRQIHLRTDTAKRQSKALKKETKPEIAEILHPVHSHMIPNVLIFTHSVNLLEMEGLTGEDAALKANVQNTISLHADAKVLFLMDDDCLASIARVMGSDSPLLDFFRKESHGMYKADICRGAALYEHGGLYMDVDMHTRMSLWSAVKPASTFVVPFVHRDSKHPGNFFQAFIGSVPNNPIIKRYLELFIDHYQGKIDLQGPLGVLLLRKAHDEVVGTPKHPKQSDQVPQYFMEVLFDPKTFPNVPPPNWGVRRACHFVVVANTQPPYVVPFYSHVKGSRMCGGADSEKKLSPRQ